MAGRKRNPQKPGEGVMGFTADDKPKRKPRKKQPKKKPDKTKAQLEKEVKREQYRERVKRMRGLFGDQFKPKDGYDLRRINSWTPQQKSKITRYFRVIAPRITGDFVVKRYRKAENLRAAIDASLQEKPLRGQTAAAFSVDPGERVEIKVVRGRATVKKQGLKQVRLMFNKNAFLVDWEKEVDRVLDETDANAFRVITGAFEQNKMLTRKDVKEEILKLLMDYHPAAIRNRKDMREATEWLNGIAAYPGAAKKTQTQLEKMIERHKKMVDKRVKDRLDARAAEAQGISVATLRRRRTLRKKRAKKKTKKKARRR